MLARRDEVVALIRSVPALSALGPEEIRLAELSGFSNRNVRVETPLGRFALRLPGLDPAGYVDAHDELEAARVAAELGLGAEIVHVDRASGAMLTRWIEGAHPLSGDDLRRDPALIEGVGRMLGRLHGSGVVFPRRFEPFAIMAFYARSRASTGPVAPLWSERVSAELQAIRSALARSPLRDVPSHCDPVPVNILSDGERLWLIDWEYAGMNDPAWDLGYFALESGLGAEGVALLLDAYGDPAVEAWRVRAHQLLAACLGIAWHAVRDPDGARAGETQWAAERASFAEALAAAGGTRA